MPIPDLSNSKIAAKPRPSVLPYQPVRVLAVLEGYGLPRPWIVDISGELYSDSLVSQAQFQDLEAVEASS